MHVVIVGAGEVGWYLAQRLGAEGHDVVVIEQNEAIASAIGAQLDVQVRRWQRDIAIDDEGRTH